MKNKYMFVMLSIITVIFALISAFLAYHKEPAAGGWGFAAAVCTYWLFNKYEDNDNN